MNKFATTGETKISPKTSFENPMKTTRRFLIVIVALMSISLSASFTHAQNRGVLGEILHRMDEHSKALQSLKADVRREIFNSQLGEVDVSTGKTSYVPGSAKSHMLVRIDWVTPREEHLAIT